MRNLDTTIISVNETLQSVKITEKKIDNFQNRKIFFK